MRMLNDSPIVAVDASSPPPPPLLTPAAAVGMVGEALQEAGRWIERDLVARIPSSLLIAALFTLAYILLSFVLNGGCTEDAAAPPHAAAAAVTATATAAGGPPATDAELKKKGLRRIPVAVYEAKPGASATDDCVICLGEFDDGDKVCVLPRCHHGFHVQCIDPSCPTCRDSLLIQQGCHAGDGDGDAEATTVAAGEET